MTKEEIVSLIESKFCTLSAASKLAWHEKSNVIHLKKSEILVEEGKRSDKIWFISRGIIRAH